MKFTIDCTNLGPTDLVKSKIKRDARRLVLFYKCGPTEILLNDYCLQHYGQTLKAVCLKLVSSCQLQVAPGEIVILFGTKDQDRLASLITYGSGTLPGSAILRHAFGRD